MYELPNFLAKVGLGVSAEFAFTTLRHIQRYDSITWGKKKDINENLAKQRFNFLGNIYIPGLNLVTPLPTLSTVPAPSWPKITGKRPSGSLPLRV